MSTAYRRYKVMCVFNRNKLAEHRVFGELDPLEVVRVKLDAPSGYWAEQKKKTDWLRGPIDFAVLEEAPGFVDRAGQKSMLSKYLGREGARLTIQKLDAHLASASVPELDPRHVLEANRRQLALIQRYLEEPVEAPQQAVQQVEPSRQAEPCLPAQDPLEALQQAFGSQEGLTHWSAAALCGVINPGVVVTLTNEWLDLHPEVGVEELRRASAEEHRPLQAGPLPEALLPRDIWSLWAWLGTDLGDLIHLVDQRRQNLAA